MKHRAHVIRESLKTASWWASDQKARKTEKFFPQKNYRLCVETIIIETAEANALRGRKIYDNEQTSRTVARLIHTTHTTRTQISSSMPWLVTVPDKRNRRSQADHAVYDGQTSTTWHDILCGGSGSIDTSYVSTASGEPPPSPQLTS